MASPKSKKQLKSKKKSAPDKIRVPPMHDWRTTDEDEINRRRLRAREESFRITNIDPEHRIYSNFNVQSSSGMAYEVEIRDLLGNGHACSCVDFRTNELGFCKHIEAVRLNLQKRFPKLFKSASNTGSEWIEIELDRDHETLCMASNNKRVPPSVSRLFDCNRRLSIESPEDAVAIIDKSKRRGSNIRISQEITRWLEGRQRIAERGHLRQAYEQKVQSGDWPSHETLVPLYPYQREGMLHLAFNERALLADEMGLGKTIQAIAACALLHRLGKAAKVLVVTPASLKSEWEEQIQKFTALSHHVVFGARPVRLKDYDNPSFFNIVNYEQMLPDALDVNQRMKPDIVVLDEAQRIKNWNTKTAQAVKRLESRYAFVLTGTPIENRIDELHSLMDFLNPEVLGPLFRFNRDFYELDERGRPAGYRNLDRLNERVAPHMVRRRKSDVETELPERTDHNHFVRLTERQQEHYEAHKYTADRLLATARKRPLRKEEMQILQIKLAMMRMICDSNFILDEKDRVCPKLKELEEILEEAKANGAKVIVFSEWERMLQLVRGLCEDLGLGYAWHTGKVPQKKRRGEINAFKSDPDCMVFLSTDSGSTGLNLQNASIVVNCDLPWNPAKLEQRIARAWRKHQTNAVTVYNLVSEGTIEHAMIGTLSNKQALADGVLDRMGDLKNIRLGSGRQAFLERLEQVMSKVPVSQKSDLAKKQLPADGAVAFGQLLSERLGEGLIRCEERFPKDTDNSVILVVVDKVIQHQSVIQDLYHEYLPSNGSDDGNETKLEIIDRATVEALERLEKAGLIAPTFRSSRSLTPDLNVEQGEPEPLSNEELTKLIQACETAARKLKMARVLSEAELIEEAQAPILEAALHIMKALAVRHRADEPTDLREGLRPPFSLHWGEALMDLKIFIVDSGADIQPVMKALTGSLEAIQEWVK
jgi:SNF2 family DNA or RNA helicase